MSEPDSVTEPAPRRPLPRNVKLLGWASLLNDTASEMIYPLLPKFLIEVLNGTTTHLGVLEGFAESTASLLKLWSGGWSDRAGRRKGFVVFARNQMDLSPLNFPRSSSSAAHGWSADELVVRIRVPRKAQRHQDQSRKK